MPELTVEQAKQVYRAAIDSAAREDEGVEWWAAVVDAVRKVCAAKSAKAASTVIAWWHHDWSCINDTPRAAAQRIRAAAKAI